MEKSMTIIYSKRKMKPRAKFDHYTTEPAFCLAALRDIQPYITPKKILDPGCGSGVWGWAAREIWPKARIYGVELQELSKFDKHYHGVYDQVWHGDYLSNWSDTTFDLILGNPPYKLAEEFVRKSCSLLNKHGYIYFLLRLAFLEGQKRSAGLYSEKVLDSVRVLSRRPSFGGYGGKTDATAYAMFQWKHGPLNKFVDRKNFQGLWLDWERE